MLWSSGTSGTSILLGGAGLLLGALLCGMQSYLDWARLVPLVAGQGTFNTDKFSLSMATLRLARLLSWNYAGGPLALGRRLWLAAAAFIGPALAWWTTRRQSAAMQCVGLDALWAPLCWSTYLPLALVPAALWLRSLHLHDSDETSESAFGDSPAPQKVIL